jgi:hypothetical protein
MLATLYKSIGDIEDFGQLIRTLRTSMQLWPEISLPVQMRWLQLAHHHKEFAQCYIDRTKLIYVIAKR